MLQVNPVLAALPAPAAGLSVQYRRLGFWKSKIVAHVGGTAVVYQFFRLRRSAERLDWLLRTFDSHGIGAQRGVSCGRTAGDWLSPRLHFVATRYVDGSMLHGHSAPDDLYRLGITLGRLHSIEADSWGRVVRWLPPRRGGYAGKTLRDAHTPLRALAAASPPHRREVREIQQWLEHHGAFLRGLSRFHLTHGDLKPNNVVIHKEGVALIDYDSAQFAYPGFELASCVFSLFCADHARWNALMSGYRSAADSKVLADLERNAAAVFVLAMLRWASERIRRTAFRTADQGLSHAASSAAQALSVVRRYPGGGAGWEEVSSLIREAWRAA